MPKCAVIVILAINMAYQQACFAHTGDKTLEVQLHQQQGPTCLVAAAVTAASAGGVTLDLTLFARHTPVFPDGVHPYDVAITAAKLGLSSLIFTAPSEAAVRLVRAGFAPIVLVQSGTSRHALVVTGVRKTEGPYPNGGGMHELRLADPAKNRQYWVSALKFEDRQSGQQMMVLFREHERNTLGSAGFPTNIAAKMDAQFRAETVYRRALKHGAPNAQMKSLLKTALKWQPCHKAARNLWVQSKFTPKLPNETLQACGATK